MLPASSPLIYIPNPKSTIEAPSGFGAGGGTLRSSRRLLALRAAQFGSFRSPAGQNAPPERFVLPASSPFLYIPNPKNTIRRLWGLVPVVGLEPTRCRHQRILSPSRLPIPSHRQNRILRYSTTEFGQLQCP